MISFEDLLRYWNLGFKLVPLDQLGKNPVILWSEIYDNPGFWSEDKIGKHFDKFHNVATTFGMTRFRDSDDRILYLYCLDIDSDEVLKRVQVLLEGEWKLKTFVSKTQKDCGYHVYWVEHSSTDNTHIMTEDCKKGFEFEIKCGKSLCTLPPSRHRDNPLFHYEAVGQSKIMIADGLYQQLVNNLLADCIKKKKNNKNPKSSDSNIEDPISSTNLHDIQSEPITDNKLDHFLTENPSKVTKLLLTDQQVEDSIQCLIDYYQDGTRDKFAFGFSGLAYKEGIAEESAAKILKNICIRTKDQERNARLDTFHRTYINGSENGLDVITGKTKLKEVIIHVSNCDEKAAENVIHCLLNTWHRNVEEESNKNINQIDTNDPNNRNTSSATESLVYELSVAGIDNPAEYAISVINKTVKCDDSLVRAAFYSGCSTYTFDPMNLVIAAPTSEGKSYTVLQTLQYFPSKDVKYIGSMSPKVIIRQNSILVDSHTLKPIKDDIIALEKQIRKENDEAKKEKLQKQLENLKDNTCPLIDLRGKVYVFLEPPDPELWTIIKPIMSHDNFVIEHPYVESNTIQGIHVRAIITLGYPSFICCTAKDESKWQQWDEIISRSLVMSPNMSQKKYREATRLNAHLIGLPTAIQESLIKSRTESDLAKKCVLYLKDSITQSATVHSPLSSEKEFSYNNPTWIPYADILGDTLPADKGIEMRVNRRLLLLLRIIALAKANLRYQVIFANQTLTIASIDDLSEALYIIQNSTGLPPYKVKFFNETFYALYQKKVEEKLGEQKNDLVDTSLMQGPEKSSSITGVPSGTVTLTANETCGYYNMQNPKSPINSENLRKTYLNELVSAGWIEAVDIKGSNTKRAYYPIVAPLKNANATESQDSQEYKIDPKFPISYKINVPNNFILLSKDWIIFQILSLWKCGIDIGNGQYSIDNNNSAVQFLDVVVSNDGNNAHNIHTLLNNNSKRRKISMREFAEKYGTVVANDTLSRHFSRPIFSNYYNKIFGRLQYIGIIHRNNTINSEVPSVSSVS